MKLPRGIFPETELKLLMEKCYQVAHQVIWNPNYDLIFSKRHYKAENLMWLKTTKINLLFAIKISLEKGILKKLLEEKISQAKVNHFDYNEKYSYLRIGLGSFN